MTDALPRNETLEEIARYEEKYVHLVTGSKLSPLSRLEPNIFWTWAVATGECWLWSAPLAVHGYGSVQTCRSLGRPPRERAHRVAYRLSRNTEIDSGVFVCHTCDVRHCVRPTHLFLGSAADNNRDARIKGRAVNPAGEAHGMSKLTEEKVRYILQSSDKHALIADKLGVHKTLVSQVKRGKIWKHVTAHTPLPKDIPED